MAITTLLKEKLDLRKGNDECDFNGYLEDYLQIIDEDDVFKDALEKLFEADEDVRICVNYRIMLNKSVISNRIIRYKDAFKIMELRVQCPIILYGEKNGVERGLMLYPKGEYNYLYAKGIYYCFTEPESPFYECKNELVSIASDDPDKIVSLYSEIYNNRAGVIQRTYDKMDYDSYQTLKDNAITEASNIREAAKTQICALEDPTSTIYEYIVKWFLLKKVCYVQYMVSKELLNSLHEGNIHKQRNQAKQHADSISFIPYSELWRMKTNQATAAE